MKKRVVDYAPLARWYVRGAYDSAAECQKALLWGVSEARFSAQKAGDPDPANDLLVKDAVMAKCVATDDPRLKAK